MEVIFGLDKAAGAYSAVSNVLPRLFPAGVKAAARRKLQDELGIDPASISLDDFTYLGRMHYKAPSNGEWGEHESMLLQCAIVCRVALHANVSSSLASLCGTQFLSTEYFTLHLLLLFSFPWIVLLAVDYLLVLRADLAVAPNPNEVASVRYVNRQELKDLIAEVDDKSNDVTMSPWFRLIAEQFLPAWWDHLDAQTLSSACDTVTIHRL